MWRSSSSCNPCCPTRTRRRSNACCATRATRVTSGSRPALAIPARPDFLDLAPVARATGTVRLPGSKSVSNRALLLAALAEGETELEGVLRSEDTQHMLDALNTLGIKLKQDGERVWIAGCDLQIPVKQADLFLGNAGTAFRPLTAALALSRGHYRLSGVPRMHERPIGDLVDALRELGADLRYLGNDGYPPLEIFPAGATRHQTSVR